MLGGQEDVIYQDLHICGACKKEFFDVVDFLHHKTERKCQLYLQMNVFKCFRVIGYFMMVRRLHSSSSILYSQNIKSDCLTPA